MLTVTVAVEDDHEPREDLWRRLRRWLDRRRNATPPVPPAGETGDDDSDRDHAAPCLDGFVHAEGGKAPRRGDAVFPEYFLALVLADLQAAFPRYHFGYHFFTVSLDVSRAMH